MPFKSEAQRKYLWANEPEIARDWTDEYGSGIQAAHGGIIGSVGGISRPKYQQGNMVGAEMEGAMMESEEVIKELYDALIAQGLSPQEAIEKIKEIIASSQAQEPQSPMMAEEFPGQEFGRAPAAFGGIMDTATGRRRYLFGSVGRIVKKAVKKVKKLASSKVGKLALMYAAGTYLGGTEAFGGTGWGSAAGQTPWKKFGAQLLAPTSSQGIGNLARPRGWSMFQKAAPKAAEGASMWSGLAETKAAEANFLKNLPFEGSVADLGNIAGKTPWYKNPWVTIPAASTAAGLYTAKMPVEELEDTTSEYDEKKATMDRYLAGLGSYEGGDYRVPVGLRAAQGGRIGYDDGGDVANMDMIALEFMNEFGYDMMLATPEVRETFIQQWKEKNFYDKSEVPGRDRVMAQEGGLMNLGGMEKDYRNDGGFVPIGGQEKADDVPARLSRNEFVFTADAVRNAGGGDIDRGAEVMENVMKNLEGGGKISEESQGQGAQEMFEVSERLSEVI